MAESITIYPSKIVELAQRVMREDDSGLVSGYTVEEVEQAVQRSLEKAIDELLADYTDLIWSSSYRLRVTFDVKHAHVAGQQ